MEKEERNEKNRVNFNTPTARFRPSSASSKKLRAAFKSPLRKEPDGKTNVADAESFAAEIESLKSQEKQLDDEIKKLQDEGYREEELQDHIKHLHDYNEMKDIGQMLLGRLAVQRGVTTKDLYQEYGLDLED